MVKDDKSPVNLRSNNNTGIRGGPEISGHELASAGGTAIDSALQTGIGTKITADPGLPKTQGVEVDLSTSAAKAAASTIAGVADENIRSEPEPKALKPEAKKEEFIAKATEGSESIWKKMVIPKLKTIFLPASCGALMLSSPTSDFVAPKEEAHAGRVIKLGPATVMQATQNVIFIEPVMVTDSASKDFDLKNKYSNRTGPEPEENKKSIALKDGEKSAASGDSEIIVPDKNKDLSKSKEEVKPSKPIEPIHIQGTKPV